MVTGPDRAIEGVRFKSAQRFGNLVRTQQDSNLRPSAPEGDAALRNAPQSEAASGRNGADLGAVFAGLIRVAGRISSQNVSAKPDPVATLRAFAEKRGGEARAHGVAVARDVLAKALGLREVALAIEALAGGPHADHRLVDLCELLLERGERAGEGRRSA